MNRMNNALRKKNMKLKEWVEEWLSDPDPSQQVEETEIDYRIKDLNKALSYLISPVMQRYYFRYYPLIDYGYSDDIEKKEETRVSEQESILLKTEQRIERLQEKKKIADRNDDKLNKEKYVKYLDGAKKKEERITKSLKENKEPIIPKRHWFKLHRSSIINEREKELFEKLLSWMQEKEDLEHFKRGELEFFKESDRENVSSSIISLADTEEWFMPEQMVQDVCTFLLNPVYFRFNNMLRILTQIDIDEFQGFPEETKTKLIKQIQRIYNTTTKLLIPKDSIEGDISLPEEFISLLNEKVKKK